MKYLILTIFILSFLFTSAQNIVIDYSNFYNSNVPMTRDSRIVINTVNLSSVYCEDFKSTKIVDKNGGVKSESTFVSLKRNLDKYFITDSNCKRIIYDDFALRNYKIEDNLKIDNWDISVDSKMIANFKTYKATCNFRGRNWTVWFAPDIPYSFGPWKLCGLPGMILEAYDENRQWYYNVKAVNLNSKEEINIPDDKEFQDLSLKEFIMLKDEYNINFLNSAAQYSRDAKVHIDRNLRAGIESKFEWEP